VDVGHSVVEPSLYREVGECVAMSDQFRSLLLSPRKFHAQPQIPSTVRCGPMLIFLPGPWAPAISILRCAVSHFSLLGHAMPASSGDIEVLPTRTGGRSFATK
jgi:hypothetical protein